MAWSLPWSSSSTKTNVIYSLCRWAVFSFFIRPHRTMPFRIRPVVRKGDAPAAAKSRVQCNHISHLFVSSVLTLAHGLQFSGQRWVLSIQRHRSCQTRVVPAELKHGHVWISVPWRLILFWSACDFPSEAEITSSISSFTSFFISPKFLFIFHHLLPASSFIIFPDADPLSG